MRYVRPQITNTFDATRTIRNIKGAPNSEALTGNLTSGPAYQADE